ncbi:glycosyltransferase family 4 protein [Kushneria aurantia]|uniref:Glycosyltransferase family 4 protein n=1 Tax=Kushneria aurantia TaxID=504092 RepID=A0ABV6G1H9_9GAMM|nr:glycosyltransferase family 4 protein [Kushneria aurantia]
MKICHVNLARGFRGGERQTQLLIEQLAERGLEQSLVCRDDSPLRHALHGVQALTFVAAAQMWQGHRRTPTADLVHAHEARAAHWSWWHTRLAHKPWLLTRRVPQAVKNKRFNRLVYQSAATAVAISSPIEAHLRQRDWCPVTRIPSALAGFTTNQTVVETLRHRFAGHRVVGHIGALVDRHKGQRLIIETARRLADSHPDMLFLMLGEGEDEQTLKAESAGLDNIVWEGFHDNLGDYLAVMDLFVFPSRHEGLGSTLLDVMNAGVPIIASRVDGIPDIVHDDDSGVLIAPDNADALVDAVTALAADPERAARLVAGARSRLADYSPAAMAEAYLALYERIVAESR